MAEAELREANPSWRQRIAELISKLSGGGDETRFTADMGNRATSALEMIVPGFATATFGNDAARSVGRGDYLQGAGEAGLAALSALPMARFDKTRALVGRSPYEPIEGVPKTFTLPGGEVLDARPIPALVDAAGDYAKSSGLPHVVPREFPKLDHERAGRIAQWYDRASDAPNDPAVREAYEALARETGDQYRALKDRGIEFEFMKTGPDGKIVDPYAANPALGYKDLAERGKLEVLPSDYALGSLEDASSQFPLLRQSGEMFGDKPATYNDLFRAVHDAFGHHGYGNPFFRQGGEERAWQLHSMMYSPKARPAMTTETRGQNSWVNSGPHAGANKTASAADTTYANQKALASPDWVQAEGAAVPHEFGPFIPMPEMVGPTPTPLLYDEQY